MQPRDHVDSVIEQWQQVQPDLDARAMGIVGRIFRLAEMMQQQTSSLLAEHGLALWEFDVLGTLRRQGKPYSLTPTALMAATLLSSGAMTNRINRLEEKGYVERTPSTDDRRSLLVSLTPRGLRAIDAATGPRFADAAAAIKQLTAKERMVLADLLRKLSLGLEADGAGGPRRAWQENVL